MSTNVGAIDLDLVLQSKSFQKQLDGAVNGAIKRTSKTASGTLTSSFSKLGGVIAGVFGVKKVVQFGASCLKLGSDLQEVQNVVDVTFGSMSGKVNEFAKTSIDTVGLSETVAKKYMGQYGAMAKAFGYGTGKAYEMSETLTKLTGDVASFYNLSTDEAGTKLKSVFTGETESLKELGVVMTQTALDDFALRNGFGKTTKAMTEQEKVALRLAFVTNKLSDASGDFARTSGGWANQTRVLSLRFEALKATIGQGLINALTPVVQMLNVFMAYLQKAADAFASFTALVFGKQDSGAKSAANTTAEIAGNVDDIGKAATGAAGAAKKAQKSLAGFDKLNVLGSASAGGGGGGGISGGLSSDSDESPAEEIKEANPALEAFKKRVNELVDLFKTGFEIGFDETSLDTFNGHIDGIKESLKSIFTNEETQAAAKRFTDKLALNLGKVTGSVASIGVTAGELVVGSLDTYLEQNGGRISDHFVKMFDISGEITDIAGEYATTIADIATVFRSPTAKQIGADIINIFAEPLMTANEISASLTRDILSAITGPIVDNAPAIKKAIEETLEPIQTLTGALSNALTELGDKARSTYDEYVGPAFQNIREGFTEIVDSVVGAYNEHIVPVLDNLSQKFEDVIGNHVTPAIEKFMDFIGKLCELVGVVWKEYLAPFIAWIGREIMPVVADVISKVGTKIANFAATVSDVVGGIFSALGGLLEFLTGVFTGDWQKAWNGVKTFFKGIWDSLVAIVKSPLNRIVDALNGLIRGLNKIKFNVPSWVPSIGGKQFGFSIPQIPRLAEGGYVEANTPQLAMIGDNRHQGEIVAPEGKITEAVATALGPIVEALKALGATIKTMQSGNGQNIIVKCLLDGKVIYETVVKQNNTAVRMTGKSPLRV